MQRDPADAAPALWLFAGLLVLGIAAAYSGTLTAPFVFDDIASIVRNPTLHSPLQALVPIRGGMTVSGRPLLNASFALDYAVSGTSVWSYHVGNLLIHGLAALTLFGLLRRSPGVPTQVAGVAALLWALHPLQTESVTYLSQRAESLAGLFYLLTLYALVRSATGTHRRWAFACVAACWAGILTKEIVVTAPVVAFFYDRTFLAGSFAEAWRRRRSLYLALMGSWLVAAALLSFNGTRGQTSGFGLGIGFFHYLETQPRAWLRYLSLSLWPQGQAIDYGVQWEPSLLAALGPAVVIAGLLVLGSAAFAKPPSAPTARAVGFAVLAAALVLLPTSLIPGTRQTMAEHRFYLPLAVVCLGATMAAWRLLGSRSLAAFTLAIVALLFLTSRRNKAYASDVTLWSDATRVVPGNPAAWNNLGVALEGADQLDAALAAYREALRLSPENPRTSQNIGDVDVKRNDLVGASVAYLNATQWDPRNREAFVQAGWVYLRLAEYPEAEHAFGGALALGPSADAELGRGDAYAGERRYDLAEQHLRKALALKPGYPEALHALQQVLQFERRALSRP